MLKLIVAACLGILSAASYSHQLIPTYPVFAPSFVEGVVQTKMELFNSRREVEYYELNVFDSQWKPVQFATEEGKILRIRYLETKRINVYLKVEDLKSAMYICTESRLRREDVAGTAISSKICSKVRQ